MVDSDSRPWLPENYYRFAQVTEDLDQHYIFRRLVLSDFTAVSITGVFLQKPAISAGAVVVGGLTYLLLDPTCFVNIPGKRLYREQEQLAGKIAQREGWFTQNTSAEHQIKRIKSTITLTKELVPAFTIFTVPRTPDERIATFDNQLYLESHRFNPTDTWRNTVSPIARTALNIGESYWEFVGTYDAKYFVEAIKKRRAALSEEGHIGFQSREIL